MSKLIKMNKDGFSMIEILLAVGISVIIMGALFMAVMSGTNVSSQIDKRITGQQDARAALSIMAIELGMASYNPTRASDNNIWSDLTTTVGQGCGVNASVTNPTQRGIVEASANSITVEADINDDGTIGATGEPNEVVRYVYDSGNQRLTRCSCCSTSTSGSGGQPFLGDVTGSTTKGVYVINGALNIPVFRYYDGSGVQITTLSSATIPNIRRIDITLAVETDEANSAKRKRMIYSTSVIPRNHTLNN
jgi:type II secretory pathway pseudopilin PulG